MSTKDVLVIVQVVYLHFPPFLWRHRFHPASPFFFQRKHSPFIGRMTLPPPTWSDGTDTPVPCIYLSFFPLFPFSFLFPLLIHQAYLRNTIMSQVSADGFSPNNMNFEQRYTGYEETEARSLQSGLRFLLWGWSKLPQHLASWGLTVPSFDSLSLLLA